MDTGHSSECKMVATSGCCKAEVPFIVLHINNISRLKNLHGAAQTNRRSRSGVRPPYERHVLIPILYYMEMNFNHGTSATVRRVIYHPGVCITVLLTQDQRG